MCLNTNPACTLTSTCDVIFSERHELRKATFLRDGAHMKICEYWRSRLFLDLGLRLCTYKNSNLIFSETTVPNWTKLCMKPFRYKEMKIWWHDAGHMTEMAATPLYGKNRSKSSPEPTVDFHETWYVASGTPAHHSLFKWWPWSDLDLFYGKVKFGFLGFSIGKSENNGFFRNNCSQWPER